MSSAFACPHNIQCFQSQKWLANESRTKSSMWCEVRLIPGLHNVYMEGDFLLRGTANDVTPALNPEKILIMWKLPSYIRPPLDSPVPLDDLNPRWRQVTSVSVSSQPILQIVPHSPLWNTSTRPSELLAPPRSRTSPFWAVSFKNNLNSAFCLFRFYSHFFVSVFINFVYIARLNTQHLHSKFVKDLEMLFFFVPFSFFFFVFTQNGI